MVQAGAKDAKLRAQRNAGTPELMGFGNWGAYGYVQKRLSSLWALTPARPRRQSAAFIAEEVPIWAL